MTITSQWYDEAFSVLQQQTFKKCEAYVLRLILKSSYIIHLNAGEVLFRKNDLSDYAYVILRGRVSTQLLQENGSENIPMVFFSKGALLGEISIISDTARSMHAVAQRDTILICIHGTLFKKIYNKYILSNLEQMKLFYSELLDRNRRLLSSTQKLVSHAITVLFSFDADAELNFLAEFIHSMNRTEKKLFIVSQEQLHDKNIYDVLLALEKEHKHILVLLPFSKKDLLDSILDIADRVIVLAKGTVIPFEQSFLRELFSRKNSHTFNIKNIVLVHENSSSVNNATEWVALRKTLRVINYFKEDPTALPRLYRDICGTSIGVVLSGAGYRGLGYVGALKALQDYHIPIDIIGGTSLSAIIGAAFIVCKTPDEFFNKMVPMINKYIRIALSWKEISLSGGALLTGRGLATILKRFDSFMIEALRIPFFCVSCDLSAKREVHHFHGQLHNMLEASSALPGLLPSVLLNDHIFVDGSVVNNTPVDVMRSIVTQEGMVITLDFGTIESLEKGNPAERFTQNMNDKARRIKPDLRKILLTSLLMHGQSKEEMNISLSNIYIRPDLRQYSFLPDRASTLNKLIDIGYKATVEAIKGHPDLQKYISLRDTTADPVNETVV